MRSRLGGWGGGERQPGDDRQLLAAGGEEGAESRNAGLGLRRERGLPCGPLSESASWALMSRLSSRLSHFLFPEGMLSGGEECIIPPQSRVSLTAHLVKNPPAMQETPVGFLDWEDLLEKG